MSDLTLFRIPPNVLNTLRCCKCKHYLSVGPIYTTPPDGLQCGRCDISNEVMNYRATEFETLAKLIQFPCKYDNLGCKHTGSFNEIAEHEILCVFRSINCPALDPNCDKKMFPTEVGAHFSANHEDLVLNNAEFVPNSEKNYVASLNDSMFIVQVKPSGHNFKIVVRSLGSECFDDNWSYKLQAFDRKSNIGKKFSLTGHKIRGYRDQDDNVEDDYVDIEAVQSVLKTTEITFAVKLIKKGRGTIINPNLLEQLECPLCFEIMHPPIFSCITGHSICCHCLEQLNCCPTCNEKYSGTRNFVVENFTKHLEYSCHFKKHGCSFVGNSTNITDHESLCSFKSTLCHVCDWQGSLRQAENHFFETHSIRLGKKVFLECYQWCAFFGTSETEAIILHDSNLFRIRIYPSKHAHAMVNELGRSRDVRLARYQFEISFKKLNSDNCDSYCGWGLTDGKFFQAVSKGDMASLLGGWVSCTLFIKPVKHLNPFAS